MGFHGSMKDLARVTGRVATGPKVEGRTTYGFTKGPWFQARINLAATAQTIDEATGVRVETATPELLYGLKDTNGLPVKLRAEDRVEVRGSLGSEVWDVVGGPEPMRRSRRVMGYRVPLRHVEAGT